ncbi:MAG: hypothetical protein GWP17_03465, partial [Aquificales bacterium]|nr:hypothetical protein [Aquificales bacterium]
MPKHLSVLWVIVVFLAAGCVRQDEQVTAVPPSPSATPIIIETAVPSPTVTILPTNTPQPTLTPTPTAETGYILQPTPTVFPVTTPVSPSEHYQLQTWDETKAMNLIQLSGNYAENVQPIIDTVAEWKEIYT